MRIVSGNILNVRRGIIVHQVNCRRVMGAGLALQIRRKYPKHFEEYRRAEPRLGGSLFTEMAPDLYVAGVYGQDGFGTGQRQTDYDMLRNGLMEVAALARGTCLPVYIPYQIGCGLAGGNWEVVAYIIESVLPEATVVRYERSCGRA